MTTKHNKKRNMGFVYEALIRELTRAAVEGKNRRKARLARTIKEFFSRDTLLGKELDCYRTLSEAKEIEPAMAEKLIKAVKETHKSLDQRKIFSEQTRLINFINKEFGEYVFTNYVPNYKDLATIGNMFNDRSPIKTKVLMEQKIITRICEATTSEALSDDAEVDGLVLKEFTKNFNKEYRHLLPEQRSFLTHYITAARDSGTEFKIFLNEELSRIRESVNESLLLKEVKSDEEMVTATKKVLSLIEEFRTRELSEGDLKKIMKLQKLVSEYRSNAD